MPVKTGRQKIRHWFSNQCLISCSLIKSTCFQFYCVTTYNVQMAILNTQCFRFDLHHHKPVLCTGGVCDNTTLTYKTVSHMQRWSSAVAAVSLAYVHVLFHKRGNAERSLWHKYVQVVSPAVCRWKRTSQLFKWNQSFLYTWVIHLLTGLQLFLQT